MSALQHNILQFLRADIEHKHIHRGDLIRYTDCYSRTCSVRTPHRKHAGTIQEQTKAHEHFLTVNDNLKRDSYMNSVTIQEKYRYFATLMSKKG